MKQEKPEIKLIEAPLSDPWPSQAQMQTAMDAAIRSLGVPPHWLGIEPLPKQRQEERSRNGGTGLPGESVGGE